METWYNEIIDWLEVYYKKKGLRTYRGLEYSEEFLDDVKSVGKEFYIDPMLPIDLLAVERRNELDDQTNELRPISYYTLHWLVSRMDRKLERKLQFYRFYLSRVCKMWGVLIVMVISQNGGVQLERSLRKIAKENGFGLWRIESSQVDPERLYEPQDFLKHMEETFKNPPKRMEHFLPEITEKASDISLFFDRFVREAVEALAGLTPTRVGKRYIERQILDSVFHLQNVSYATELKELVIEHLREKGDDYQFVKHTFSTLWSQCAPEMSYSNFLEIAELPLYNIFAERGHPYRDHYLHQFQVFLLGLAIIDKLMGGKHPSIEKFPNIDKQWLITSSFHDMAYPLQLYDVWAKEFFDKSLGIPNIGVSDLKSCFVDKSLLSTLGFLMNALCEKHFDGPLQGNWLHEEQALLLFLYDRITKLKHHCLLSSLFLLKQAQQHRPDLLNELFVPASLAIALHHYNEVFRKTPREEDEVWKNLPSKRKLRCLEFDKDPLTFLLIFCDCAQEWGRPVLKYPKLEYLDEGRKEFVLSECAVTESGCSITISSPQLPKTHGRFRTKLRELENLERFLRSLPNVQFKITLEDKSGTKSEHIIRARGT